MKSFKIIFMGLISLTLVSCEKEFLEKKPNKALLIPTSLSDFQTLLDNEQVMNVAPALGVISGDEYFLTDALYSSLSGLERNAHIWNKEIYDAGSQVNDWNYPYQQVFNANVVLEGLEKAGRESEVPAYWDILKGSALFYRGHAFYQLAQLFAAPYNAATAASDKGIPIRLSADVTVKSERASLKATYDQIIADLTNAAELLPVQVSYKTRPSKAAALALLARTYLAMQDYNKALFFANAALEANSILIDFNTLNPALGKPIAGITNPEILFYSSLSSYLYASRALISADDVNRYHANDLRKVIFFNQKANGETNFKGTYTGNLLLFGGLAVNEILLIKAECLARSADAEGALSTLNSLLEKRWKKGTFVPLTATSADEALALVLEERKKELLFRGTRWTDLRRLNKDNRFARSITRTINGQTSTLEPNNKRYILPIPDMELQLSGIEQNER